MMLLRLAAVSLLLLAPLHFQGGGPVPAQSLKDDDFAEFEDDDLEFDFEVSDDEDCKWLSFMLLLVYYRSSKTT